MEGRPPIGSLSLYKPEYCQLILEYVGKKGKSVVQFAARVGVSRATVYNWKDEHPAFLDAFTRAQEESEAFWQNELVSMMREEKINSPLVKLYFANRFNWHDKKQVEHSGSSDEDAKPISVSIQVVDGRMRGKEEDEEEPDASGE